MTGRPPARLLPADAATREIALELYAGVADAPILAPHGHVEPGLLLENEPFGDAADLFVVHDHYVVRLLHAGGVPLDRLRPGAAANAREIWRSLATSWHLFAGTASGYWLEEELAELFGLEMPPTAQDADRVFDQIGEALRRPEFRPRALFERFRIEVLATTDDPLDDLSTHRALAASDLPGRVIPTFRPDHYLDPDSARFASDVDRLLAATGSPDSFAGYLDGLRARREVFIAHGATTADHGVQDPRTLDLDAAAAASLFDAVRSGRADARDRAAFRAHMLLQMARMSVDDGLVMTIHAGVLRNHSTTTLKSFGPNTGHDIPVPTSFVEGMRPLLERFGLEPGFHLVLYTVDEATYSRELAPLAGFYPSVYLGAPWWFLDAPDAFARFRSATIETAGFYRYSGFVDDTRAFLSVPARHDTARRVDAGVLARLVVEGRVDRRRATAILRDVVDTIPREVFKL